MVKRLVLDAENGIHKLLALTLSDDISPESLNKLNDMLNDFESIMNDPNINSVSYLENKWDEFCKKHGKIIKIKTENEEYEFELRYEGMLAFYFYISYLDNDILEVIKFENVGALKYILFLVEEDIADVVNIIYQNYDPKNEYFINELTEAVYYYFKHKSNDIGPLEKISYLLNTSLVKYKGTPYTSLLNNINLSIDNSEYKDKVLEILSYDISYPQWFLDYIYSRMPVKVDVGFLPYIRDMVYLIMIALSTNVLDGNISYFKLYYGLDGIYIKSTDDFAKIYNKLNDKLQNNLDEINMYYLALCLIPDVFKPYKKYNIPIQPLAVIAFGIVYKYINLLIAVYYLYNKLFILSDDEFKKYINKVTASISTGRVDPILDILLNSRYPMNPDITYEAIANILNVANAHKKVFFVNDNLFSTLNICSYKLMFSGSYGRKLTMRISSSLPEFLPGVIEFKYVDDKSNTLDIRYTLLIINLLNHLLNIVIKNYAPPEECTDVGSLLRFTEELLPNLYKIHEEYVSSKYGEGLDIKLSISNYIFLIRILFEIFSLNMDILYNMVSSNLEEDYKPDCYPVDMFSQHFREYMSDLEKEEGFSLLKNYIGQLIELMYLLNYYYGLKYNKIYKIESPLFIKTKEGLLDLIEKISLNCIVNKSSIVELTNLKYTTYDKYLQGRDILGLYNIFRKYGPSLYQRLDGLNKYVEKQINEISKCKSELMDICKSLNGPNYIKHCLLLNEISTLSNNKLIPACRTYVYYALLKDAIMLTNLYENCKSDIEHNTNVNAIISYIGTKLFIDIENTLECIESKSYNLYDLYNGLYGCYTNYVGSLIIDVMSLTLILMSEMIYKEYNEQLKHAVKNIESGNSKYETISIDIKQIFEDAIYKLGEILNKLIYKLERDNLDSKEVSKDGSKKLDSNDSEEDDIISLIENILDDNFEPAYEIFVIYMMSDMILAKLIYNIIKLGINSKNVIEYANIVKATNPANYDGVISDILNNADEIEEVLEKWFKNIYEVYIR